MGTGKTAVGKAFAGKTSRGFVDLDEAIVEREKCAVTEIFSRKGEAYFRSVEKESLKAMSLRDRLVVACGGGVVIDPDNIAVMKETGVLICLSASARVISQRTANSTRRPLLNVPDPEKKIEELLRARAPLYARADHCIDTSGLTVAEVVDKILLLVPR